MISILRSVKYLQNRAYFCKYCVSPVKLFVYCFYCIYGRHILFLTVTTPFFVLFLLMTRFNLFLSILLYYLACVLILRAFEECSRHCVAFVKLQCRLSSVSKRKSVADSIVTNVTDSWKDSQVTAMPTKMSASVRTAYDEAIFTGKFGLLMDVVPSSILFDVHASFRLYSSHVILSKRIPAEDQWYTKDFIYQRDSWFESYLFFTLGSSPIWNCWRESEKFTTNR